jgi:hypothetical protein
MDINLALEVKAILGNSTPMTEPSMESSPHEPGLPTARCHSQDWPDLTQWSTSRHAKTSSGK